MDTPQQRELARSGLTPADPSSTKARPKGGREESGDTGPVPDENRPGHRPEKDQDKPDPRAFVEKAANPGRGEDEPARAPAEGRGGDGGGSGLGRDAVDLLVADHRRVDRLFEEYEDLGRDGDPSRKLRLAKQVIRELSVHAAIEEQYLYPTISALVDGGREIVSESLEEHQQLKGRLAAVDRVRPADSSLDAQMKALIGHVRHHVEEEEREVFPRLRERLGRACLTQLAFLMQGTRLIAPTRPHPEIPNTPPGNFLLAPMVGMIDRTRDTVEGVLARVRR